MRATSTQSAAAAMPSRSAAPAERFATHPPRGRSRLARGLTLAAASSHMLNLQVCAECATVQYPPRAACGVCLSDNLMWREQPGGGRLLAVSHLHHSNDAYLAERLPRRIGTVQLDVGPTLVAFVSEGVSPGEPGQETRVRVALRLDRAGEAVLVAQPETQMNLPADELLARELGCSPVGRAVLVSDAHTPVGQALVHALVEIGARCVWAGHPGALSEHSSLQALCDGQIVKALALDASDVASVAAVTAQLEDEIEIVISNPEAAPDADLRAEWAAHCEGRQRLFEALAPALQKRVAQSRLPAVAWVNLLSVFAFVPLPARASFSAAQAAAMSLSIAQRATLMAHGVRLINAFPGPMDDAASHALPPPKLRPAVVAKQLLQSLSNGLEDAYLGDVAQELFKRWRDNPKALEREIAQHGL